MEGQQMTLGAWLDIDPGNAPPALFRGQFPISDAMVDDKMVHIWSGRRWEGIFRRDEVCHEMVTITVALN